MASYDRNLRLLLGSLLVGCSAAIFLQGALCVQFNHYFRRYRDDHPIMRMAVTGLVVLTTLKTCQSFAMLWIEFIESFADPGSAFNNFSINWTLQGNPLMVAATGLYIRAYFCYRLFVISKAWWTAALVATTDLVALSFIAVGIHFLNIHAPQDQILLFYTLHFSLVFAGDLLLTLLTAFFLLRSKKRVLPQTEGFINALIWMTFETAAPGAICSLISLIFSRSTVNGFQVISAFNEIIPQLYAVSMMWTLNARHELRGLTGRGLTTSHTGSRSQQHVTTKGAIDIVTRDDVQLHNLNGVKVQREMITHVSDVFAGQDASIKIYNDMGEGSDTEVYHHV